MPRSEFQLPAEEAPQGTVVWRLTLWRDLDCCSRDFHGGFKLNAHVGGTEDDGQVLVPLTPGLASLVIDKAGLESVGVWGSDVPTPGEGVASVGQNLPPLVAGRQLSLGNFGRRSRHT